MTVNDIVKNMEVEVKQLYALIETEFQKEMAEEIFVKIRSGEVSANAVDSKFIETMIGANGFIKTTKAAIDVINSSQSRWSGGQSVSNLFEQIKREVASRYLSNRVYPINIDSKVKHYLVKMIEAHTMESAK